MEGKGTKRQAGKRFWLGPERTGEARLRTGASRGRNVFQSTSVPTGGSVARAEAKAEMQARVEPGTGGDWSGTENQRARTLRGQTVDDAALVGDWRSGASTVYCVGTNAGR